MADIDLSQLSLQELRDLIEAASKRYLVVEAGARAEEVERKLRLAGAITRLQNLLGPEESTANQSTIRGVLAFGDTVIARNPGTAVVLIMKGLEEITETVLDLATALANT